MGRNHAGREGRDTHGELGNNSQSESNVPVAVSAWAQ
jgi:hypothetical protein